MIRRLRRWRLRVWEARLAALYEKKRVREELNALEECERVRLCREIGCATYEVERRRRMLGIVPASEVVSLEKWRAA
jgi:hypothetical protein